MSDDQRIVRLREIFAKPPGHETWMELWEQLEGWQEIAPDGLVHAYLEQHLSGWPDALRCLLPDRLTEWIAGKPHPMFPWIRRARLPQISFPAPPVLPEQAEAIEVELYDPQSPAQAPTPHIPTPPELDFLLRADGATHVGPVRQVNEDGFACSLQMGRFLVLDGMGGSASGAAPVKFLAHAMLGEAPLEAHRDGQSLHHSTIEPTPHREMPWIDRLIWQALTEEMQPLLLPHRFSRLARWLGQLYDDLTRFSAEWSVATLRGTGAALVCVDVLPHHIQIHHAGDCRLYLWRHGQLHSLITEHTLYQEYIRAGLLSELEDRGYFRDILVRAFGVNTDTEFETTTHSHRMGDLYLLCSDGLYDAVDEDQITAFLQRHGDALPPAQALIQMAVDAETPDNVTALFLQICPTPAHP